MRLLSVFLLLSCVASARTVWFEPNRGQVAGQTEWIGRSKGPYLYITGDEVVYANQKNVHMRLVGASRRALVEGLDATGGISSYFTGRDEKTWYSLAFRITQSCVIAMCTRGLTLFITGPGEMWSMTSS